MQRNYRKNHDFGDSDEDEELDVQIQMHQDEVFGKFSNLQINDHFGGEE